MYLTLDNQQIKVHTTGVGAIDILLIPGGPGFTLDYLQVVHKMFPPDHFRVISYQPSGTQGNINNPFLKSMKDYAAELKSVLDAFHITSCYLLGHSWGGVIAQEFLFQYPAFHTKGVILANCAASGTQLTHAIKARARNLPETFHDRRNELLATGSFDDYFALLFEYWLGRHFCRVDPVPGEVLKSIAPVFDSTVYYYYLGFDLINPGGALLYWDRTANLPFINCPVLQMSGDYDYLTYEDNLEIISQIPQGELWYEKNTSHMPMYENQPSFENRIM